MFVKPYKSKTAIFYFIILLTIFFLKFKIVILPDIFGHLFCINSNQNPLQKKLINNERRGCLLIY